MVVNKGCPTETDRQIRDGLEVIQLLVLRRMDCIDGVSVVGESQAKFCDSENPGVVRV